MKAEVDIKFILGSTIFSSSRGTSINKWNDQLTNISCKEKWLHDLEKLQGGIFLA